MITQTLEEFALDRGIDITETTDRQRTPQRMTRRQHKLDRVRDEAVAAQREAVARVTEQYKRAVMRDEVRAPEGATV